MSQFRPRGSDAPAFSWEIDSALAPDPASRSGKNGIERIFGVLLNPLGRHDRFFLDEVILLPGSTSELDDFLERYQGAVINDGAVPPPPPEIPQNEHRALPSTTGQLLVRVELQAVPFDPVSSARP